MLISGDRRGVKEHNYKRSATHHVLLIGRLKHFHDGVISGVKGDVHVVREHNYNRSATHHS